MIDPLSDLAIRHGTDKYGYHDYTPNYHKLFARFRDRPVKVLEIGVGGYSDEDRGGQSLATWRDYFPQGEITGIDIQKKVLDLGPRVRILRGSQIDPDFLNQLVADCGPFDIIIDDGSHRNEHVVTSFGLLWPGLNPGGVYVAEDVQTAFMPRFGGSLTREHPNSVGYFADLMARMDARDDPDTADIAAMERFHNMIALHKADPAAKPAGVAGSGALDRLGDDDRTTLTVGKVRSADRFGPATAISPDALAEASADCDIVVLGRDCQSPETLRAGFARLRMPGLLILDGGPAADSEIAADLTERFAEVDHREIRVAFPDAPIDPMAGQLYAIERHGDGMILVKAPNDYPSNFAYDPENPQAAAALANMEKVLADCDEENGLVQYATILTNTRGRSAARPWLDKLADNGATSRTFFQLAAGLAQSEKRLDEAVALFERALQHFPGDPGFALGLGSVLIPLGRPEDAEAVVAAALEHAPRDVNLMLLRGRIAERRGLPDEAIAHARKAVEIAPAARKPPVMLVLAEFLAHADALGEAETTLHDVTAEESRYSAKAFRLLSTVKRNQGDIGAARDAAEKALALSPQTKEYRDWHAALAG